MTDAQQTKSVATEPVFCSNCHWPIYVGQSVWYVDHQSHRAWFCTEECRDGRDTHLKPQAVS